MTKRLVPNQRKGRLEIENRRNGVAKAKASQRLNVHACSFLYKAEMEPWMMALAEDDKESCTVILGLNPVDTA
jgi:hypothetical protein